MIIRFLLPGKLGIVFLLGVIFMLSLVIHKKMVFDEIVLYVIDFFNLISV